MLNLIFVLTTECNFNCPHCLRDGSEAAELPFSIIEKTVAGAKKYGIENIHLTGGEPFLYKDLDRVFGLASSEGIPVTFSSNGTLLAQNQGLLERYRRSIKLINVSFESPIPEVHDKIRGQGAFAKITEAFAFCRGNRIPFGILTCLNKWNAGHVFAIARFAKKQKASQVNFSTVLPCRSARSNNLLLSQEQRTRILADLRRLEKAASLDFFRLFYVPVRLAEALYASDNIVMCVNQALRTITVDVEGSIHFCCYLTVQDAAPHVLKDLRIAQLKDMGFDEGLRLFAKRMFEFLEARMDDFNREKAPVKGLDFNSCFYCSGKFGI